jgi:hypothetical protein
MCACPRGLAHLDSSFEPPLNWDDEFGPCARVSSARTVDAAERGGGVGEDAVIEAKLGDALVGHAFMRYGIT